MFKSLVTILALLSLGSTAQAGFMCESLGGQYAIDNPPEKIYHDDKGKPEGKQEQPASIFWEEYPDELLETIIDWSLVWAG